jgi:hypothetical protein
VLLLVLSGLMLVLSPLLALQLPATLCSTALQAVVLAQKL